MFGSKVAAIRLTVIEVIDSIAYDAVTSVVIFFILLVPKLLGKISIFRSSMDRPERRVVSLYPFHWIGLQYSGTARYCTMIND